MTLIENFPCDSKRELETRERHWFDELKPTLNSQNPINLNDERAAYMKNFNTQYYIKNRNKILENDKLYRIKNNIDAKMKVKVMCECQCVVSKGWLNEHRKTQTHKNNMIEIEK